MCTPLLLCAKKKALPSDPYSDGRNENIRFHTRRFWCGGHSSKHCKMQQRVSTQDELELLPFWSSGRRAVTTDKAERHRKLSCCVQTAPSAQAFELSSSPTFRESSAEVNTIKTWVQYSLRIDRQRCKLERLHQRQLRTKYRRSRRPRRMLFLNRQPKHP